MKTTLLILFLTLLNLFSVRAQFSRAYMFNETNSTVFKNFVLKTSSNEYDLIHLTDSLEIVTASINAQGDVTAEKRFQFPFTYTISGAKLNITGVFDSANERTFIFSEASNTSQNIHFIRYDKTSGNLLAAYQSVETSKGLAFSTQLINGEYVHYYVTPTLELKRLSVNQLLSSETLETVPLTLTNTGLSGASFITNTQYAKLLIVGGIEKLIVNGGVANITFCTRTAANSYTTTTTSQLSAYPFDACFDGTSISVLTRKTVSKFDSANNLLTSSVFTGNNSGSGIIVPKNGDLFVISKRTSNDTRMFKLNASSVPIDSIFLNKEIQFRPNVIQGTETVLLGQTIGKPHDYNYSGEDSLYNSFVPLLISFTNIPELNHQEYRVPFQKDNLTMSLCVGENVIYDPISQVAALKYNNLNSIVYSASSQVVSKDASGTVFYGTNYRIDHLAGPYTTNAMYDQVIEAKFNRGFLVSKQMILDHLDAVSTGVPNYVAQHAIRNWPAHGDVSKGQAADLAPFVDVNGNGLYEPYLGDYPSIYGDQCFLSVSHSRSNLIESDGIEMHTYLYSIECNEVSFENTLFKKVIIYSRKMDLDSVYILETDDIDLGNYADDYAGTHVELGMTYFYNGDAYDEDNSGVIGFKEKIPAFGIMNLKGTQMVSDGIDNQESPLLTTPTNGFGINDGVIDNEYYTMENSTIFSGTGGGFTYSDPQAGFEWWNIANGFWKFGDEKLYGSTSIQTKYMFPWTSDSVMYGTNGTSVPYAWSEYEPTGSGSTANPSGDRRVVSNSKSFSLVVGKSIEYDYAYVFNRDSVATTDVYNPVISLIEKATAIKNAYNDSTSACGYVFSPIQEDLAVEEQVNSFDFSVYPNPTSGKLTILQSESIGNSQIFVSDAQGKIIVEKIFNGNETTIDLNQFEGNLFFVTLINNQQKAQKKIVKL